MNSKYCQTHLVLWCGLYHTWSANLDNVSALEESHTMSWNSLCINWKNRTVRRNPKWITTKTVDMADKIPHNIKIRIVCVLRMNLKHCVLLRSMYVFGIWLCFQPSYRLQTWIVKHFTPCQIGAVYNNQPWSEEQSNLGYLKTFKAWIN